MAHSQDLKHVDVAAGSNKPEEEITAAELERLERISALTMNMYNEKYNTNCVVKVGDVEFPVHKFMLAGASSVFAEMFHEDTDEKENAVVIIQDIKASIVEDFLKFIYSGKVRGLNVETAVSWCKLAYKYDMIVLRDICLGFLNDNITVENMYDAAVLAHAHGATELEEKVTQFFRNRKEDIEQSNAWKHFLVAEPMLAIKFFDRSVAP